MDASGIKLVVCVLGVIGLVSICCMAHIAASGREPPAAVVIIAGNAIGALVGILVQQRQPPNERGGR